MSELFNYEYYHNCCGPIPYEKPEHWINFFGMIADRIVEDLSPKTVLDAGCAMGYLVAALRDRGVEAFGIDISRYALSRVREDIKSYCFQGSLTDPLPEEMPQKYDLVVSIEVLEHLYAEDGKKAVYNLCQLADCILFCSSSSDFSEKTHFNVQQREYWARLFAENGFLDNLNYRPTYITPYAVCYYRSQNLLRQIEDYERNLRQGEKNYESLNQEYQNVLAAKNTAEKETEDRVRDLHKQIQDEKELTQKNIRCLKDKIQYQETQIAELQYNLGERKDAFLNKEQELMHYQMHYNVAIAQREELKKQVAELQDAYAAISNAFFWKITKPFRLALDFVKKLLRKNHATRIFCKGLKSLKQNGVSVTWEKVKQYRKKRKGGKVLSVVSGKELQAQRNTKFPREIKFSIVVPLYNTPEKFLREMIQSVLNQTYANWELCMADGSDPEHRYVETICKKYAAKDSRILYQKLEKNLGISENTNACLRMVAGDYIGLLDHDDILHPSALFEVMKAICEKNADLIYTDENTFHHHPSDAFNPHFKPDFAPDNLRANNYICHFTVFKKTLMDLAGKLNAKFDGSQDYDLILRLTEKAKCIFHIPKILYFWRAHSNSVAENIGAKPYVIEAAHQALSEHLQRVGLNGKVLDTVVPSIYRIKYVIDGNPLVTILIPNCDHLYDLKKCIESIFSLTSYRNFEVIILENNSTEKEIFFFYRELQNKYKNVKVVKWKGKFNYSAINNFGYQHSSGEYIIFFK